MPKFKFAKLVRDKIVENQLSSGAKPSYRQLDSQEHKQELVHKIIEEAKEITLAKPEDVIAEIADVQQALDDLIEKYDITANDIAEVQKRKNRKNGAFKKGHFIDYVEVNEEDTWTQYYRANSDRYPEIY